MSKPGWRPSWARENHQPDFVSSDGLPWEPFGSLPLKYLWGNMPAIGILSLANNEGASYSAPIGLCFVGMLTYPNMLAIESSIASGDARNAIKTLLSLPEGYPSK